MLVQLSAVESIRPTLNLAGRALKTSSKPASDSFKPMHALG